MRAVVIGGDGELTVESKPDPRPGAGEVLVRVRAAGLNGADLLQRRGAYPAPPGVPADIPGLEFAGDVIECGPYAGRFSPGDRVMAVVGGGAQAELVVVHEREAMPVPRSLSWAEAGGLPEVFITAHDALMTQAGLQLGERLCVHGAAGGVGTAAVQLGLATGARVVGTVRSPERRGDVARLGAVAIDPADIREHGPFDVVLELVGAPNVAANIEALAVGGRICFIGVSAGAVAEVNFRQLMARRGHIMGSTLRARPLEGKAAAARLLETHVLPLFDAGRLSVPIDATFPLARAVDAYEHFARSGKFGKVLLTVD